MNQQQNYLRIYRKRSPLTQSDIAFLLNLSDYSNISRYEKGQRKPSAELLLVYHLLFNTSIESLFEPKTEAVMLGLVDRMQHLVDELKASVHVPRNASRIRFLEQALTRLTE